MMNLLLIFVIYFYINCLNNNKVSFGILLHGDYLIFLINLPVIGLHIWILSEKKFQYMAFTAQDETLIKNNQKILIGKLCFYPITMIIFLSKFMSSLSALMIYRIFG